MPRSMTTSTYDEEYGDENTPPSWFPGGHLPDGRAPDGPDPPRARGRAARLRGQARRAKPLHRITAWALLVVFGLPVVFAVLRLLDALAG